jgi:hypothetical protein
MSHSGGMAQLDGFDLVIHNWVAPMYGLPEQGH